MVRENAGGSMAYRGGARLPAGQRYPFVEVLGGRGSHQRPRNTIVFCSLDLARELREGSRCAITGLLSAGAEIRLLPSVSPTMRSIARRLSALAILLALLVHPSRAQSPTAYSRILKFGFSGKPYDAAARSELAKLFVTFCRDVLAAVPTNTPAEDAWVRQEGNTTDVAKISRLVGTVEYARHKLKDTFSACVARASDLTTVQQKPDWRAEAAGFISLAAVFNEDADLKALAERLHVHAIDDEFLVLYSVRRILLIAALRTLDSQ